MLPVDRRVGSLALILEVLYRSLGLLIGRVNLVKHILLNSFCELGSGLPAIQVSLNLERI